MFRKFLKPKGVQVLHKLFWTKRPFSNNVQIFDPDYLKNCLYVVKVKIPIGIFWLGLFSEMVNVELDLT